MNSWYLSSFCAETSNLSKDGGLTEDPAVLELEADDLLVELVEVGAELLELEARAALLFELLLQLVEAVRVDTT